MSVNVTMIGGGSSSFVPPLLRRLIRSDILVALRNLYDALAAADHVGSPRRSHW